MNKKNSNKICFLVVKPDVSYNKNIVQPATSGNQLSYVDSEFVEFSRNIALRQFSVSHKRFTDEERKLFGVRKMEKS